MQTSNKKYYTNQSFIQTHNPLKNVFVQNVSTRSRNVSYNKSKNMLGTIQISNKYCYAPFNIIGKGFTSKVYKGCDINDETKTYAIKVIQKGKLSYDQLKLVRNQIEIHPKLLHQNIVKCYDVFETSLIIYVIMEFCPNGDLSNYIEQAKSQKVIEIEAISLIKQIISGYKYLIQEGILHRDLKPANVLISGSTFKISDFGFAVKGKKTIIDSMNVGTPLYMPPQSIQDCVYSHKSDFFALGCILYQLLHGKTPWFKRDEKALLTVMKKIAINLDKIENQTIRQFIIKACQISQGNRMTVQQFMNFQFTVAPVNLIKQDDFQPIVAEHVQAQKVETIPLIIQPVVMQSLTLKKFKQQQYDQKTVMRKFLTQKTDRTYLNKRNILQNMHYNRSLKSSAVMQDTFASNHRYFKNAITEQVKKITAEFEQKFEFFLLLKYLIKNFDYVILLEEFSKKNLKIITYRHCIYILKRILSDCARTKAFDLAGWQSYKKSTEFQKFQSECKSQKQKLQKQFNLQLKGMSLKNLTQVSKNFSELSFQADLKTTFYEKLKQFLRQIIRQQYNQVAKKIQKSKNNLLPVPESTNCQYLQGLRSLYRYYEQNQRRLHEIEVRLKQSRNLTSGNIKHFMTTKNSRCSSTSTHTQVFNKKSKPQLDLNSNLQLVSKRKVSFNKVESSYFFNLSSHKSSQNHLANKNNALNFSYRQTKNTISTFNIRPFEQNQQEKQQNQPGKTCNKYSYTINQVEENMENIFEKTTIDQVKIQQTLKKQKSLQKILKHLSSNEQQNIEDYFAESICKDYQKSGMIGADFQDLKKKLTWVY